MTLAGSVALFVASAAAIAVAGTRLSATADRLADRTGLGEAVTGAILLGGCTSLPGITASVTAAWHGHATLALSNAIGGIAAQTAFLVIADMAYAKANLEHAAASVGNLLHGSLLIVLLALLLVAMITPEIALFGIHPVTPLLLVAYVTGVRLVRESHDSPMWRPRMTHATRVDEPERAALHASLGRLWGRFALTAAIVVVAGWALTRATVEIAAAANLSHSLAGGLLVAVATSLPELVTSVAAVRRGALTLAVSGVLGGNVFDTLFAAVADLAYRDGSIYHAATFREPAMIALTIAMTGVVLLGLLRRERRGIANIGLEGPVILALYATGLLLLNLGPPA